MDTIQRYNTRIENAKAQLQKFDACKVDEDPKLLKECFDILFKNDLITLYSVESDVKEHVKFNLFSQVSAYSGALAFLQVQNQAAFNRMEKHNFSQKEHYFDHTCGVAVNHLRSKEIQVEGVKCTEGYSLNGILTWASGFEIFEYILVGFVWDNQEVVALCDFKMQEGFNIQLPPAQTFVANSLNTVNITLTDFIVKDENVIYTMPRGHFTKDKSASITVHAAFYGLGRRAGELMEDQTLKDITEVMLDDSRNVILNTHDGAVLDKERIILFEKVQRIITTAMIQHGGKSNLSSSEYQRLYRELMLFNANGLNHAIKGLFRKEFIAFYDKSLF